MVTIQERPIFLEMEEVEGDVRKGQKGPETKTRKEMRKTHYLKTARLTVLSPSLKSPVSTQPRATPAPMRAITWGWLVIQMAGTHEVHLAVGGGRGDAQEAAEHHHDVG